MNTKTQTFSKLLLPVDTLEAFKRAAPLAGLLIRTMRIGSGRVDLMHVVEGTFLKDHMNTIDVAAGEVPDPHDLRRLRDQYLEGAVMPLLESCRKELRQETEGLEPGSIIKDGDPVKMICKVCQDRDYSTLIMSRRKLGEGPAITSSSVVAGVLHRHAGATIYLAGEEQLPPGVSPFARCLIGVDESAASMNAVHEASLLIGRVSNQVEQVYLVHVLDQSCYYVEEGVSCLQASLTGQQALEAACSALVDAGVDQQKITTVIHFGRPGTVLVEEIIGCQATMIFIGRRDRSRMAQVFLGSVCTEIVQNCRERTLVLAS